MLLELKKLFQGEESRLPFEYEMDLSKVTVNTVFPFVSPVIIKGEVRQGNACAYLTAGVEYNFIMPCDRCNREIRQKIRRSFQHTLVPFLEGEDDEEVYILADKDPFDLDALLRDDILLDLPTKFLCTDDCKGLCPTCGKDLNDGPCQCVKHSLDPRLEVLKKLID